MVGTRDLLYIQDDRQNGVARLALRGELDLATAPKLEEHVMLVERDGVRAVVLDLRDLTFVDCEGLHAFVRARGRADENGHRLAFVGANDQLRKLLQLTATEGMLDEQEGLRLIGRFTKRSSAPSRTSAATGGNPDG